MVWVAGEAAGTGRVRGLDAVRGLAALTIGVFHCYELGGRPGVGGVAGLALVDAGYLAVDVFFVLSGLVLFLPVVRRGGDVGGYGTFVLRRVTRLWPCCLLAVGLGVAVHAAEGVPSPPALLTAHGLWVAATNVSLLSPVLGGYNLSLSYNTDPVVWSLAVEVCFSLCLPLVARAFFRRPVRGLVLAVLLSRSWVFATTHLGPASRPGAQLEGTADYQDGARWVISLPTYAAHFALGMALACLLVRHGDALRSRLRESGLTVLVGLGLVATVAAGAVLGDLRRHDVGGYAHWTATWPILVAMALLLPAVALAGGRTAAVCGSRAVRLAANASYPFYLLQWIAISVALHAAHGTSWAQGWAGVAVALATLPPTFAVALVLHRVVEQPAADWGRRRAARSPRGPQPVPARA